jgi:2-hydroxy-3-oxopropionate reductase
VSKVGFIGLGIMGRPMARNLMKAGFSLMVYNRTHAKALELAAEGAEAAASPAELAAACSEIITMLPNSPQVRELCLGEGGILSAAAPGTLVIDMTSGAPTDSREIAAALAKRGIRFLDAPVSGGEPMAVAGTLTIMAGGSQADFDRARPLFAAMGSSATLVGGVGSGNTCKLTNQIIVAGNIAALSEGLMLAKKAGCDLPKVFEAIRGGLAGSAVMNAKAPMILADNFKPGFRIDLHSKDLSNALETGHAYAAPLPLTAELLEVLRTLSAGGDGSCDHSAIAKFYEKLAGTAFAD